MSTFHSRDDLFENFNQGSEPAFRVYYDELHEPLHRYLFLIHKNQEVVEDTVQDAFVKLWETRSRLKNELHLKGSLYIIARNAFINKLRRMNVERKALRELAHLIGDDSDILDNPELVKSELLTELYRAVEKLPKQQKKIVSLRYLQGKTVDFIAAELNISPQTVRNTYSKGLKKLEELMPGIEFLLLIAGFSLLL